MNKNFDSAYHMFIWSMNEESTCGAETRLCGLFLGVVGSIKNTDHTQSCSLGVLSEFLLYYKLD